MQQQPAAAWCSGRRPGARLRRLQAAAEQAPISQRVCRLKLLVAYDGTGFSGFQFQAGKKRTVQAELEKAAARVLLPAGRAVGASRTDGGAHATGQVVHLDVAGDAAAIQPDSLVMCLNGVLPDDVKVQAVEVAPPGFDSHFSSCGKAYEYRLSCGVPDPMQARQAWWVHDRWCERQRGKPQAPSDLQLNVEAMQAAARHLLGCRDFSTFMDARKPAGLGAQKRKRPKLAKLAAQGIKPVRTAQKNTRLLWQCDVLDQGSGSVVVRLAGSGFLYRMVRLLAAGLVEVGHGRLSPDQLKRALDAGDRAALPVEAAPPHGLYLTQVLYQLPDGVDAGLLEAAGSSDSEEPDAGGGE